MRLKRNSTKNSEIDSTASSVKSADSFGIFASACSDCSECEYSAARETHNHYGNISSSSCTNLSFHSAADRETHPLLLSPNLTNNNYKSISSSTDTLGPGELSASDIIATYEKTLKKTVIMEKNRQSSLVTIFSVWNTIMGSSLLTMAWGVERAGLPAALFLIIFMAALCLYTAYVLLRVNYHHGTETCEVPALCRLLLGAGTAAVAHAFSLMVLLGANVLYWLLISNFLYYTVNYLMELSSPNSTAINATVLCPAQDALITPSTPLAAPSPYWGLHTTVPFYVAIIVFPLLNFTKVSFFTKFNSLGTLSVFYLIIFIIVKGWMWGINMGALTDGVHGGSDAAVLSGMLALSFYIHNIIITIMSNNARQEKNGRDLSIAFLLVTVTYALVGVVFYICFPLAKSCIEDNLLNNFEMHDVMTAIARALLLFQVITVYPLVVFMIRCEAAQLCARAAARGPGLAINLAVVALSILVACLCPNIGTIIRYTGAISGLVHVFALPSLLQMRSLHLRGKLTVWKVLFYSAIIVFGTVNLVMQFFIA
ncbi:sodium-coupled neutral amino acid transporter 9 homolog [Maniola hyperantus]|uniref:sodium-coupled neutral amino acid transporter 9 homolog n=1 Tax=Aphantopus hyperantus TaxID=2795564 RepID=UPI001569E3AA|nr:sodium-coupled neutral amino acid transporter 9 homolog [Maniola hyperantus]